MEHFCGALRSKVSSAMHTWGEKTPSYTLPKGGFSLLMQPSSPTTPHSRQCAAIQSFGLLSNLSFQGQWSWKTLLFIQYFSKVKGNELL